jgi:hypothetical protein
MFTEKSLDVYENFLSRCSGYVGQCRVNIRQSVFGSKPNFGIFMTLLRGAVAVEVINRRFVIE